MSSACTISSSSVVRRCISPSTSSGTLVVHLQWNVGVFCHLHRQWYVDESSPYIISGTVIYLFHAFSGTLVCVIVSGTAVHLFHRQWYVDELHLLISSVVRWYISLSCLQWNVGMCYRQWYIDKSSPFISSVVRWYISLHAFIGTLVCVIVSG